MATIKELFETTQESLANVQKTIKESGLSNHKLFKPFKAINEEIDKFFNAFDSFAMDRHQELERSHELFEKNIANVEKDGKLIELMIKTHKEYEALFKYFKEELNKGKEIGLNTINSFNGDKFRTVYQPIQSAKSSIVKFEALGRFNIPTNNFPTKQTPMSFGEVLYLVSDYANGSLLKDKNKLIEELALNTGITPQQLNAMKIKLSQDIFALNINQVFEDLPILKENSRVFRKDKLKLSINIGKNELYSDNILDFIDRTKINFDSFVNEYCTKEEKVALMELKVKDIKSYEDEVFKKVIANHIVFEILEHPCHAIDNFDKNKPMEKQFDNPIEQKEFNNMVKNFQRMEEIGAIVVLDDVINTKDAFKRIDNLNVLTHGKTFSSIKIDQDVVKKVYLYQQLKELSNYTNGFDFDNKLNTNYLEKFIENEKNKPQSIFKTLGLMEHLENIVNENQKEQSLNTLFKIGNEGVMDTIKLSYYNSFTFDINEYDNFEKTLKDDNQSQLIIFENIKQSIQKEVNMTKRTNPNEIKNITYEYIEDKSLIPLFAKINNGINPEVKLSYQGFALMKPTSIEGIDINNKREKELIEQRKNNINIK